MFFRNKNIITELSCLIVNKIRIVILSLIIIWAAISLAMIVQNIYSGPERNITTSTFTFSYNSTYPNIPLSAGFDILKIIEYTVFAWIVMLIISLIFYFKSTLKILYKAIISFLGILILFGIVYIISIFLSKLNTSTSSSVQGVQFSGQYLYGSLSIIAVIIVFSILLIYIISKNFPKAHENVNINMNRSITKMIKDLKFSNDVRGSILKVYYELSNMLREHGIIENDYLTPREFENITLEKAHIDSKPFETIVKLFEEARYSVHELNDYHREEAISALEKIRDLLGEAK